jgi:hypothetical protein
MLKTDKRTLCKLRDIETKNANGARCGDLLELWNGPRVTGRKVWNVPEGLTSHGLEHLCSYVYVLPHSNSADEYQVDIRSQAQ